MSRYVAASFSWLHSAIYGRENKSHVLSILKLQAWNFTILEYVTSQCVMGKLYLSSRDVEPLDFIGPFKSGTEIESNESTSRREVQDLEQICHEEKPYCVHFK